MLHFDIRPTDGALPSIQVRAPDAAAVLTHVQHLSCQEADVDRDGVYAFSLRLDRSGLWSIFQR